MKKPSTAAKSTAGKSAKPAAAKPKSTKSASPAASVSEAAPAPASETPKVAAPAKAKSPTKAKATGKPAAKPKAAAAKPKAAAAKPKAAAAKAAPAPATAKAPAAKTAGKAKAAVSTAPATEAPASTPAPAPLASADVKPASKATAKKTTAAKAKGKSAAKGKPGPKPKAVTAKTPAPAATVPPAPEAKPVATSRYTVRTTGKNDVITDTQTGAEVTVSKSSTTDVIKALETLATAKTSAPAASEPAAAEKRRPGRTPAPTAPVNMKSLAKKVSAPGLPGIVLELTRIAVDPVYPRRILGSIEDHPGALHVPAYNAIAHGKQIGHVLVQGGVALVCPNLQAKPSVHRNPEAALYRIMALAPAPKLETA